MKRVCLRLLPSLPALLLSFSALAAEVSDLSGGQSGALLYRSSVESVTLEGELVFPESVAGKLPAIVIAHGSGGLDGRSRRWASFFQTQGMATLVIDYFGPRGVYANSSVQPIPVHDAMDALRLLATHPRIDAERIAIIGFSRGGHLAYESANNMALPGTPRYAAHVALYPSCGVLGVSKFGLTAPVLLLVGANDDLVPAAQCEVLAERAGGRGAAVTLKVYDGAWHGWDGDYSGDFNHRALNRTYRLQPDAAVTAMSQADVMAFLQPLLKLPPAADKR